MKVSFVPLLTFSNRVRPDSCVPMLLSRRNTLTLCRRSLVFSLFLLTAPCGNYCDRVSVTHDVDCEAG